jgi:glucarate dehydratase
MKVARVEAIPVSVPYAHRELSSVVVRDGVTDILVRVETEDGLVGWGESCSGADAASVAAAIAAMAPLVVGRDPWNGEAIRSDLFNHGLWQFRSGTGNFAFAGIDMALLDICGKSAQLPLYRLFGGLLRQSVDYFFYLARGTKEEIAAQCEQGRAAGFGVFYLKVGLGDAADLELVATARDALGAEPRLRLDANGAWTLDHAVRILKRLADYDIDFVEQPVRDHPVRQLAELRLRVPVPVCANEGLWSEAEAYDRITSRQADVFCLSPYWVGSLAAFHRLAHVAHLEGLGVCKHTHGELGIAATACQHVLLTLPNIVEGNQQTAHVMAGDVVAERLPIATGPRWGVPVGDGLGVEVDPAAVEEAHGRYLRDGQFLPWRREQIAREVER